MLIFPIISLAFIALLTRYITKSWISPGGFFSLCWLFFLIAPIIFASEYKIDHIGIWFITIFAMSLSVGSIVAITTPLNKSDYKNSNQLNFDSNSLSYILSIFCLISFFGIFMLLKFATNIYSSENYSNGIMMIPNLISIDRYAGLLNYPIMVKYSLYFIYPSNLLGGLILGIQKQSKKIIVLSFLPLIGAILLGIIEGARTSIILGIILFFSSWLSTKIFLPSKPIDIKEIIVNFIFRGGLFIIFFTLFFILIQWLRQGMDAIVLDILIEQVRAYFFGYLSAFSQWIGINGGYNNFNNGLITFAGPFNLIGIMERPLGFYDSISISNGISTNIFTAFRGIISDFSILGAIALAFIIGFITQLIFQNNDKTLLSSLPISIFYSFTLYSPLISIFHYNSILFSWVILFFTLGLIKNYEALDNYS